MDCQSCLNDPTVLVVADTSVTINLNATGCSEAILDALPNRFVVVEEVRLELEEGQRNGRQDANALSAMISSRLAEIVQLGEPGTKQFSSLVSGPAINSLDDGEAATIAYALEHGATALIDERKATRICANRFADLSTGCTMDILIHDNIQKALGREALIDAVFNALYFGRMRVGPTYVKWVVDLIGPDRAAKCSSLPKSARPSRTAIGG